MIVATTQIYIKRKEVYPQYDVQ